MSDSAVVRRSGGTFTAECFIAAPPATAWAAVEDVPRWPEWTTSIARAEALDAPEMAPGRRFRITQPRLPVAVWTVTDVVPGRSFRWQSASPGVRVTADHEVLPEGTGCRVRLRLAYAGLLGGLVANVWDGLTRDYMAREANGLRRRCEGAA